MNATMEDRVKQKELPETYKILESRVKKVMAENELDKINITKNYYTVFIALAYREILNPIHTGAALSFVREIEGLKGEAHRSYLSDIIQGKVRFY